MGSGRGLGTVADSTHTLSPLNLTVDPSTGLPSVSTDPGRSADLLHL